MIKTVCLRRYLPLSRSWAALLITILGLIFVKPIAFAMGATPELYKLVAPYMLIMNIFFISKGMIMLPAHISGIRRHQNAISSYCGCKYCSYHNRLSSDIRRVWLPALGNPRSRACYRHLGSLGAILLIYMAYRKKLIKFGVYSKALSKSIINLGLPVFGERLLTTIMQMVYTRMVMFTSLSAYAAIRLAS